MAIVVSLRKTEVPIDAILLVAMAKKLVFS